MNTIFEVLNRIDERPLARAFWHAPFLEHDTHEHRGILAMNIYESDKSYVYRLDIPGYKKEDIRIELVENSLKISGKRKVKVPSEAKAHYRETGEQEFDRTHKLPGPVKAEKMNAKYQDGVLEIELEKVDEIQPKLIDIQ